MAKFEAGKEKTGGRVKGTQNKVDLDLKNAIEVFLIKELTDENLTEIFKNMKGWQKLNGYKILLPYTLPHMQSIAMDLNSMTDEMAKDILKKLIEQDNDTPTGAS